MDPKYETLIKTLDCICNKAPRNYKLFHPNKKEVEKINVARSLAFIHLYLQAQFGIINFDEANKYITEGTNDGGLDAYFIDKATKTIFFIQSKFRTNKNNFEEKEISANELSKMDIKRIIEGETKYENGSEYNGKIKAFQRKIENIDDFKNYKKKVVILGNLGNYNKKAMARLLGIEGLGFESEIFNFEKAYEKLVLAICGGKYYRPEEITISLDLIDKSNPVVDQKIETTIGTCKVTIVFVPTLEIAKILQKYKNSILDYNPRNYLSLKKNEINKRIEKSITNLETNDFALLNNGITILVKESEYIKSPGNKFKAKLKLTAPQIINGAQTAYTLSKILEKPENKRTLEKKEVMIKIIDINPGHKQTPNFIEKISDATNQQNRVVEADRRSNDPAQTRIQKNIFHLFGYFYARKRGEFENGISDGYLDKKFIIEREQFIKSFFAFRGKAAEARRTSENLFKEEKFRKTIGSADDYAEMFFAYQCSQKIKKTNRLRGTPKKIKRSLRYGQMAVISAIGATKPKITSKVEEIEKLADQYIKYTLDKWTDFERFAKKRRANKKYIIGAKAMDYDNYYKGGTLDSDIKAFWKKYHPRFG